MFPEKSAEDILGRWYQCYQTYGAARLRLSNLKLVKKTCSGKLCTWFKQENKSSDLLTWLEMFAERCMLFTI